MNVFSLFLCHCSMHEKFWSFFRSVYHSSGACILIIHRRLRPAAHSVSPPWWWQAARKMVIHRLFLLTIFKEFVFYLPTYERYDDVFLVYLLPYAHDNYRLFCPAWYPGQVHEGRMTALGMKAGETCNFFGCSGVMKFKSIEYHELDRKIVEKCDLCEYPTCGVLALSRSSES